MKRSGTVQFENDKPVDESILRDLKKRVAHETMENVYIRYSIMRVRLKISYQCFLKEVTLVELWMIQIMKSFKYLSESTQIPFCSSLKSGIEVDIDEFFKLQVNDCLRNIIEFTIFLN